MALYVAIVPQCSEDAERHGQTNLVKKIKDHLKEAQNLVGFHFLLPTHFLKKGLGRSFRLIGYYVPIQNDELVVFLRVLARGSNDYEYFLANWDTYTDGVVRRLGVPSDDELNQLYVKMAKTSPPAPLSSPNNEELSWLFSALREGRTAEDELLVLETEAWVKKMRSPSMREFLALYHQLLESIELDDLELSASNTNYHELWDKPNKRLGLAYVYRPDVNRLLLLEPLRQQDDVQTLLDGHITQLSRAGNSPSDLSRLAGRSYPFLMVLDQDAWLAIQKDEEANLALSPEEAELLESIRCAGSYGELGYPLFINGRAGSGKSTMLQYLAADYIDFALRNNTGLLPIYLTCSRDLLEEARETVRRLLTTHHKRLLEGKHDESTINGITHHTFAVFHDHLYSLLPSDIQRVLSSDRFVNYAKFRRLWESDFAKRPEARHISIDIAWHTIRSYIKGIRSTIGDELAPEEFGALPRKRRSVSLDTYRMIYDRVWDSWYKRLCNENGYWDDQDLVASALDAGVVGREVYAVILCDEAQDFTPIELEFILQLSVFSRRSLQPEQLKRVPFVFAGDPLQTLNPTGFRWDAVQADFHDRFYAILDPRRRAQVEINYKELKFNYRSNPGIVKFCNLIQLLRAATVSDQNIQPQEAWWLESPVQVVWFAVDDAQTKEQLPRHPEFVKIVNCSEGEETEYVRQDPLLGTLEQESNGVFRNILGPMRAKGLEFPAVVLYRFGQNLPDGFHRLLAGDADLRLDPETLLPYEYFLNRLYVAASRAKGQLIVVDSREAIDAFWRFGTDAGIIDDLMARAGGADLWQSRVASLVKGQEQAWSGERIDPHEQAREYKNQGVAKRDPYLLRQAALAFRSAGDELEAERCLALASEFEGKFDDAGSRYKGLGQYEESFSCYWKGKYFKAICELVTLDSSLAGRPESRAADFMAQADGVPETFLSMVLDAAKDDLWLHKSVSDATWCHVFGSLAERLAKLKENRAIAWGSVHALLKQLADAGIALDRRHLAPVAFRAGRYVEAVELWEISGKTGGTEYLWAKARLEPFPKNLISFGKLKDYDQVLREWESYRDTGVSLTELAPEAALVIADAALEKGKCQLAVETLEVHPERSRVRRLVTAALKDEDVETTCAAAAIAARLFVRERNWEAAILAAERADLSRFRGIASEDVQPLLEQGDGARRVFESVVFELAASDDLVSETSEKRLLVSEFLHRHFVAKDTSMAQRHSLRVEVVGAAIERTGRIVNALQYYEALLDDSSQPQKHRFAAQRLVRNLEKHAEYFRSTGDPRQSQERGTRALRLRDIYQLGDKDLPDYPRLPEMGVERGSPTQWTRGPYKVLHSRVHNRLRIEHTERFETVTVYIKEQQLRGDAAFSETQPTTGELEVWQIDDWGMTIHLLRTDEAVKVRADFDEGSLEVDVASGSREKDQLGERGPNETD